jgi:3-oxoacyl-[acyl-carrier-protein] synthase-1
VFGGNAPPVTGFKWSFGHLIAAAGILETTLALEALAQRVVPGVAALRELDPDCAGIPVSAWPQVPRSNIALILCRGFGGTDAALLVRGA